MGNIIEDDVVQSEMGIATATALESAVITRAVTRAEAAVIRYLKYDPVQRSRTEYYPVQDFDYMGRGAVWESEGTQAYLRRQAEASVDELQVRHIPIRATPAIDLRIDYDGRFGTRAGSFAADSLKTEGTDYWPNYDGQDDSAVAICRDGIIRSMGQWPLTPGSVRVIYTAGYSDDELQGAATALLVSAVPIWEAVLEESVRRARKALVWARKTGAGHVAGPFTSEKLGDYSFNIDASLAARMFGNTNNLMPSSMEALQEFVNVGWPMAS